MAVITGGAHGIGRAYAERFAKEGAKVAIADIDNSNAAVEAIKAHGGDAMAEACDVTDETQVNEFVQKVAGAFGTVDILVNNAGVYPFQGLEDTSFEDWRKVMSINLDGPFLMCKAVVPLMKNKDWGRIVNISSTAAWMNIPSLPHYMASKMGVVGLTRSLASEYGESGILVNAVSPGFTRTKTTEETAEANFEIIPPMQAVKRVLEPEDLVGIVSWLCSDDNKMLTAQNIGVDGGCVRL